VSALVSPHLGNPDVFSRIAIAARSLEWCRVSQAVQLHARKKTSGHQGSFSPNPCPFGGLRSKSVHVRCNITCHVQCVIDVRHINTLLLTFTCNGVGNPNRTPVLYIYRELVTTVSQLLVSGNIFIARS
jgi:hypothetical protein